MHEVVTGKLAATDLARIILHIQIQQSDLSSVTHSVLSRTVIETAAGRLVDPRRQQMPFGMLPVTILRLKSVLAIAAGVAAAVVAVAAVVARIAGTARETVLSRCRSAVFVVLARQVLAFRQRTVPLRTNLCAESVGRCGRVILV